jgi:ssDNA-binding Zn-finger/Zn-ribbon topoisomerase 1
MNYPSGIIGGAAWSIVGSTDAKAQATRLSKMSDSRISRVAKVVLIVLFYALVYSSPFTFTIVLAYLRQHEIGPGYLFAIFIVFILFIAVMLHAIRRALRWYRIHKPCAHGKWSGSAGRCGMCTAEAESIKQQHEDEIYHQKRKSQIQKQAKELRSQEIERLSSAWVSNASAYFKMTPRDFETAVAELFRKLGYQVEQTKFSNDGGKDAIAWKNGEKYLIECKKYGEGKLIGRRDLQIFTAAMMEEKAAKGFYVNTGGFTKTAVEYAAKNGIRLYDKDGLPQLVSEAHPLPETITRIRVMCSECGSVISLPVGDAPSKANCPSGHLVANDVTESDFSVLSTLESPKCHRCGEQMRPVKGSHGLFWGCSRYPNCKSTRPFQRRH